MSVTTELGNRHKELWERMVTHPFVREMGDGTLAPDRFRAYFVQDYIFVRHLVSMTALGISKAPDLQSAAVLSRFLGGILDPESDLFVAAFNEMGVPEQDYLAASPTPTTQAFGDFIVRTGLEGDFDDIVTVLYVTEATYLDWGTRLLEQGKRPGNPVYRKWIDIHGPEVLGELVRWLGGRLDRVVATADMPRIESVFVTALRYEYLFWQAAYDGEQWPDQKP